MNAAVHGERIAVAARAARPAAVEILVDDDGPASPPEPLRGSAFRRSTG